MLGLRKKSKVKKKSLGFVGGMSGSVNDVDDRVVMLCEEIPSEETSWDSGRGSHSSGARSSSDELSHGWRSRTGEGQSMSSSPRPAKQYSVREIRHVESSPVYGQNSVHSSQRIRDLYESALTVALCSYCACSLS